MTPEEKKMRLDHLRKDVVELLDGRRTPIDEAITVMIDLSMDLVNDMVMTHHMHGLIDMVDKKIANRLFLMRKEIEAKDCSDDCKLCKIKEDNHGKEVNEIEVQKGKSKDS